MTHWIEVLALIVGLIPFAMAFTAGTPGPGGTPICGKEGRVVIDASPDVALETTEWSAQGDPDLQSYATSATSGFKRVCKGNKQLSGTVQGKMTEEQVLDTILEEGDSVVLKLKLSGDSRMLSVNAVIGQTQFASNQESGEPSTFQFDWLSDGEYQWGAAA